MTCGGVSMNIRNVLSGMTAALTRPSATTFRKNTGPHEPPFRKYPSEAITAMVDTIRKDARNLFFLKLNTGFEYRIPAAGSHSSQNA